MKTKDNTGYGIYLDTDFCRDEALTPAQRIVLGQIRQYAKSSNSCTASNERLARDCGVSENTITNAIALLQKQKWINVSTVKGGRRVITANDTPEKVEGENRVPQDAESETVPEAETGLAPKIDDTHSQELGGHLNIEFKDKRREEDSSSSLLINSAPKNCDDRMFQETFREWVVQVISTMRNRSVETDERSGSTEEQVLKVPAPGSISPVEIRQIRELAEKCWPGCDPVLGFRQVLRAAAWSSGPRARLQHYSNNYSSSSLSARALLRIGGKDDPLSFIRDCMAAVPPPPPKVELGTEEEGRSIARYGYNACGPWKLKNCWDICWREAVGRCKNLRCGYVLYMSCASYKCEEGRNETPLPWMADSLTRSDFDPFYIHYQQDRLNAWTKGPMRRDPDPYKIPNEYSTCLGCLIANAVAKGVTDFRSRSCLRCAATDLRITEAVVNTVPEWKGTAAELAQKLESLAAGISQDIPPSRDEGCGQQGCELPSYIRCAHGLSKGESSESFRLEDILYPGRPLR